MKIEIRSLTILVCAALALISCTQKPHDPEPENLPIGFRPTSQAVMVKSGNNTFPHDDFGVWGIATEPLNEPYILWNESNLALVSRVGETETFAPLADAYWLTGYEYYFLALAPFNNGATGLTISKNLAGNQLASYPSISFTYDLTDKYNTPEPDYDFDLLGAAQYKKINTPSEKTEQNLLFWHLFSQININVTFVDGNGTTINTGTVSQMRLLNVDKEANYIISFNNNNELAVSCQSNSNQQANLTFDAGTGTVNILPQNISDFEMYIDFTINEGTAASPKIVSYNDFKINLNIQNPTTNPNGTNPPVYNSNDSYSWNIKIGPKQKIGFTVTVNDWQTPTNEIPPIDII